MPYTAFYFLKYILLHRNVLAFALAFHCKLQCVSILLQCNTQNYKQQCTDLYWQQTVSRCGSIQPQNNTGKCMTQYNTKMHHRTANITHCTTLNCIYAEPHFKELQIYVTVCTTLNCKSNITHRTKNKTVNGLNFTTLNCNYTALYTHHCRCSGVAL